MTEPEIIISHGDHIITAAIEILESGFPPPRLSDMPDKWQAIAQRSLLSNLRYALIDHRTEQCEAGMNCVSIRYAQDVLNAYDASSKAN